MSLGRYFIEPPPAVLALNPVIIFLRLLLLCSIHVKVNPTLVLISSRSLHSLPKHFALRFPLRLLRLLGYYRLVLLTRLRLLLLLLLVLLLWGLLITIVLIFNPIVVIILNNPLRLGIEHFPLLHEHFLAHFLVFRQRFLIELPAARPALHPLVLCLLLVHFISLRFLLQSPHWLSLTIPRLVLTHLLLGHSRQLDAARQHQLIYRLQLSGLLTHFPWDKRLPIVLVLVLLLLLLLL